VDESPDATAGAAAQGVDLFHGAAGHQVAMVFSLMARTPLKVDVVRDRAALSRIVAGGRLENVYRLQIMNATETSQRYRISAQGLDSIEVVSESEIEIEPAQSRWVAVRLQIPYGTAPAGSHTVHFDIESMARSLHMFRKKRCSLCLVEARDALDCKGAYAYDYNSLFR